MLTTLDTERKLDRNDDELYVMEMMVNIDFDKLIYFSCYQVVSSRRAWSSSRAPEDQNSARSMRILKCI